MSGGAEISRSRLLSRLIIQTVIWIGGLGALFFMLAGTLNWPAAWLFLLVMLLWGLATGFWLARHDPALLAERLAAPSQATQER